MSVTATAPSRRESQASSLKPRVLIVEDETALVELLRYNLEQAGFRVAVAYDGEEALRSVQEDVPDLILLDWMLPLMSGIEVCRQLRRQTSTANLPIIMLTARGEEGDRVRGLDAGADDYVPKPFSPTELVARIRAVLRRTRGETDESAALRFEDLELDEDSHEVSRGGRSIDVSPTEFKLLRYLMLNPNRVLSKAQILDHVWDYDFRGESGIVESYISYLRRKIDVDGVSPLIHTKRGVGYVLRKPPEA
jgi:phosphate regulon transcriptional regulator PhoB